MREIKRIFWHCAATRPGQDVTAATIREWHKAKGWSDIGYHYVIELDADLFVGRPLERQGAGVYGHNGDSIHIVYVGGLDENGVPTDTRTPAQRAKLYELTAELIEKFPGATVHGHNEYANKACPSFNAGQDWQAHLDSLAGRVNVATCPHCNEMIALGKA